MLVVLDATATEDGALDYLDPAVAGREADMLGDRAGGNHKLKNLFFRRLFEHDSHG